MIHNNAVHLVQLLFDTYDRETDLKNRMQKSLLNQWYKNYRNFDNNNL